jgi:hypothetical protein
LDNFKHKEMIMADAPDNSSYILADQDFTGLPNARYFTASGGLVIQDSGSNQKLNITSTGQLASLFSYSVPGMITYDATTGFTSRTFQNGTGIAITNPGGQGANPIINVVPSSTKQLVSVYGNGDIITPASTRANLNLIAGGRVSITVLDNTPLADAANVTIDADAAADVDATYIVKSTADLTNLPNAQALGGLSTGILKSTTLSGVGTLSIAVSGTDYQSPSPILTSIAGVTPAVGTLLVGDGIGFDVLPPGPNNTVLTSSGTTLSYQAPVGGTGITPEVIPNAAPPKTLVSNHYYTSNNSSLQTFTLPVAPSPGDFYKITGFAAGGWTLTQNAGQSIKVGNINTTTGTGGSISSVLPTDSIDISCVDANNFSVHILSGEVSVV